MVFQIGSSMLDFLVLAILSHEDAYGYILTRNAKEVMDISDSTLYPVLRRLQKEGALTTYDQPFGGRNRRYYSITDIGREKLFSFTAEWEEYKGKIDKIIAGGVEHD